MPVRTCSCRQLGFLHIMRHLPPCIIMSCAVCIAQSACLTKVVSLCCGELIGQEHFQMHVWLGFIILFVALVLSAYMH